MIKWEPENYCLKQLKYAMHSKTIVLFIVVIVVATFIIKNDKIIKPAGLEKKNGTMKKRRQKCINILF